MKFHSLLLASLSLVCPSSTVAITHAELEVASSSVEPHANHIFNAINSAMRQWGSSLNHNGMSFFLATVPAGTELYHGTSTQYRVNGTEWLAFEPEHSLLFARGRRGGPPGKHPGKPGHGPPPGRPGEEHRGDHGPGYPGKEHRRPPPPPPPHRELKHRSSRDQLLIGSHGDPEKKDMDAGYLHTYIANKDLHLIYLDGMSAAKSEKGTLDQQDIVLLNETTQPHFHFWERERAEGMCKLAETEWGGKIDGILRMEGGFEIILCSFAKNLDVSRITRAKGRDSNGFGNLDDSFAYFRAITDRYHGIGGDRVAVNYDNFVSAFDYPELALFQDDSPHPRLNNITDIQLRMLQADIRDLALNGEDPTKSVDWQAVTDQIVTRYAQRLKFLTSKEVLSSAEKLAAELDRILRPYIDYENRDRTLEAARCARQFLPTNFSDSAAARSVQEVSQVLCGTLVDTSQLISDSPDRLEETSKMLLSLVDYLGWPVWKECDGCAFDEICLVPIWPHGSYEDWLQPSCTNATEMLGRWGYWGDMRPPPM